MMRNLWIAFAVAGMMATSAWAEGIDIFQAARADNLAEIEAYAKSGKPLNVKDEKGSTPLIIAAYNGHLDAVKALLDKGADACLADARGQTALMGVSFKGYTEIAALLSAKCDVNAKSAVGQTALMFAALFGRQEVAQLLLSKGANPNIADIQGNTAETLAKSQGNQAMVDLLTTAHTK